MNMFLILLRYIPSQLFAMCTVLLTWILAPLLALFYTKDNQGREWLIKPLRWFQTHDAPLDSWRTDGYYKHCSWADWDFTKPFHRYLARYFWICRNPAYGFAVLVGIVPTENVTIVYDVGTWDSATTNYHFIKRGNCFQYRAQLYFYKNHYLRLNLGWKVQQGFSKCMIVGNINPFRTWKIGA